MALRKQFEAIRGQFTNPTVSLNRCANGRSMDSVVGFE